MPSNEIINKPITDLPVIKHPRAIEALLEIATKIIGLYIVYWLFTLIGNQLLGEDFRPDTLLSLVVLPAIYILKDLDIVLEPYFVRVLLSDEEVTVESGLFTKRLDCLQLKTVENIELETTIIGKYFNYGTLYVYTYGSLVAIPHIENPSTVYEKIKRIIVNKENIDNLT